MERVRQDHDEELFNYLEGKLDAIQTKELKAKLEGSSILRARLELFRELHVVLSANKVEQPAVGFTQKVMSNLQRIPETSGHSLRNGLLLFFGIVAVVGIIAFLLGNGLFDQMNQPISLEGLQFSDKVLSNPLPPIPFNGKLMMNGLIIINLALALILLDRTILKPWFGRRSRRLGV